MPKGIIYTPRIRKSPFFEETLKYGATNFTTYNHMTMPVGYTTPEEYFEIIDLNLKESKNSSASFFISNFIEVPRFIFTIFSIE